MERLESGKTLTESTDVVLVLRLMCLIRMKKKCITIIGRGMPCSGKNFSGLISLQHDKGRCSVNNDYSVTIETFTNGAPSLV